MTIQLIDEATYNYLKAQPVVDRAPKQQEDIEAYETHHNLNVDAEEYAPTTPVELNIATVEEVNTNTQTIVKDAANDESEAPAWTVDAVEQDAELVEQMKLSLDILDDQLSIADERYLKFLALAAKATCLVKWTGPFELNLKVAESTVTEDNKDKYAFAKHVANTLGLLSFNHLLAESVLNKEIKEYQVKNKYVTICSVPVQAKRDSAVPKYDEVKKGCQFVVHTEVLKYEHNAKLNIAKLENIFSSEEIKDAYKETSTPILRVRLNQQEWVEKNEKRLAEFVVQFNTQHKAIAPKVKTETFKAWSGILLVALLWDKTVFDDMVKLMTEQVGTQGLEGKEKLACALSLVIPKYETFITRFNAEKHITTKLVGNLVKGFGLDDTEISKGFTDLGLPMGQNKGGYELEKLKTKYLEVVNYENSVIQAYLTKLQLVENTQAA